MALLAMVSLAGVMVSHIIVLSDFIEHARAQGHARLKKPWCKPAWRVCARCW